MIPVKVKCSWSVNRGDSRWSQWEKCGHDVVEGHEICSFHEKVRAKRIEKDRMYEAKRQRGDELQKKASELSEALGIEVQAEYGVSFTVAGGGYTGRMVVPLEFLEALARKAKQ